MVIMTTKTLHEKECNREYLLKGKQTIREAKGLFFLIYQLLNKIAIDRSFSEDSAYFAFLVHQTFCADREKKSSEFSFKNHNANNCVVV